MIYSRPIIESPLTSAPKTPTNTSVPTITTDDVIIVAPPPSCWHSYMGVRRGSVSAYHDASLSRGGFSPITVVSILCKDKECDAREGRNATVPGGSVVALSGPRLLLRRRFADCRTGSGGRMWLTPSALELDHSNSSHPLKRLPKTSVRSVVETRMSPLSFSTPTMRSCTPNDFDANPPSSGVNPIKRSLVMKTAP